MADAAELLTGLGSRAWVVAFGVGIAWASIALRYATIASRPGARIVSRR